MNPSDFIDNVVFMRLSIATINCIRLESKIAFNNFGNKKAFSLLLISVKGEYMIFWPGSLQCYTVEKSINIDKFINYH